MLIDPTWIFHELSALLEPTPSQTGKFQLNQGRMRGMAASSSTVYEDASEAMRGMANGDVHRCRPRARRAV